MRQLSFLALSAIATAAAFAAVPAQAQTSWAGPYAGLNAGYGFAAGNQTKATGTDTGTGGLGTGLANGSIPSRIRTGNDTALWGIQGGYNWRLGGMWLLGGEADFDGGGMSNHKSATLNSASASATGFTAGSPLTTTVSRQLDWLLTARARAGIIVTDPLLLFITGGLAFAENKNGISVVCNTCAPATSTQSSTAIRRSDTGLGFALGAGGEWAINPQMSLKAEYLYVDTGHSNEPITYAYGANGSSLNAKFHNADHIIRVGFNYHFNAPPASPPMPAAAPPPPAPVVPQAQTFIVFFEFDKSTLTADGKNVVDAAATAFRSGKSNIAIAGYTDAAGTQQYNLALSKRRADAVKTALERDGVPASVINESWHGKENQRVPTANGVREPQNRRVEIMM
jgi:OmpA-OmpF porin, OOP family